MYVKGYVKASYVKGHVKASYVILLTHICMLRDMLRHTGGSGRGSLVACSWLSGNDVLVYQALRY